MASIDAYGSWLGNARHFLFKRGRINITLDEGEARPDQRMVLVISRRTAANTSHVQVVSNAVNVIVQIERVGEWITETGNVGVCRIMLLHERRKETAHCLESITREWKRTTALSMIRTMREYSCREEYHMNRW